MTYSRALDTSLAIAVSLAMVALVMFKGDALYLGLWYYFVVPTVVLGACAALRPAPLFLFGAALAIAISILVLMAINWRAASPEGLLGLGHVFSLPGALAAALGSAIVAKNKRETHPFVTLLFGLGGYGVGYSINQLMVCNTVMWCGPLSLAIR